MTKKLLVTALTIVTVASVANAEPRFGVTGLLESGANEFNQGAMAGFYLTDSAYSASLTFGSQTHERDGQGDTQVTALRLAGNYKQPVDSQTAMTVGAYITSISGQIGDVESTDSIDIDSGTEFGVNVGVEREIAANWLLVAQVDLFKSSTISLDQPTSPEISESSIFNSGRIGLAYLF